MITFEMCLFFAALVGASANFTIYPLILGTLIRLHLFPILTHQTTRNNDSAVPLPSIQLVIIGHAPGPLLRPKLENSLSLHYPEKKLDVLVGFDGPLDQSAATETLLRLPRVKVIGGTDRVGKCLMINKAMEHATAEVIVFTDMDALLAPNALHQLVRRLHQPSVGGVCGQRVISEHDSGFTPAQRTYIRIDSRIKQLEEKIFGSITSSDGKLYAMRRKLFRPLPAAVTDDLYNGLSVVLGGSRFVFESTALAFIRRPSRGGRHEITRRRRIVCRSLTGIFARPQIFLPWRYRGYGIGLFMNKVNRRLLPFYLLTMLITAAVGSAESICLKFALGAQIAFYSLAILFMAIGERVDPFLGTLRRLTALAYYYSVGNLGVLLGWLDYLRGRRTAIWMPNKHDPAA